MRFRTCAALTAPILAACCAAVQAQQVSGNAFNPAISLILNGHYASYSRDPTDWALSGFLLDAEAGLPTEGLSLDETELAISANIDDKYYGFVAASIDQTGNDTSLALEEGYIETLALPKGLKIKAGRFLSDVGYLNPIHSHAWDFDDSPLAYTAMLNGAYKDTGLQLKWVAPTPLFVELGAELMRGDSFPAAGAAHGGVGASTLFVHLGGDVGSTSSWRAGLVPALRGCERAVVGVRVGHRRVHGQQRSHDRRLCLEVGQERQRARSLLHRAGRVFAPQRIRHARGHDHHGHEFGFVRRHTERLLRAGRVSVPAALARWNALRPARRQQQCRNCGPESSRDDARPESRQRHERFLEQRVQPVAAADQSRPLAARDPTTRSSSNT